MTKQREMLYKTATLAPSLLDSILFVSMKVEAFSGDILMQQYKTFLFVTKAVKKR